jgi:hypothetical protein
MGRLVERLGDDQREIVERILGGRRPPGLPQLLKPLPLEWEKQKEQFA